MTNLPEEYIDFYPYALAYERPWLIIFIETLRYHKAFPKKRRIQENHLKKLSNDILVIASEEKRFGLGGSFQDYMKRYSDPDSFTNEKYYIREREEDGSIFYRYNINKLKKRVEAERIFSVKKYDVRYGHEKHGIFISQGKTVRVARDVALAVSDSGNDIEDRVSLEVRDAKGEIKK
jgi:hypothetical protein